MEKTYPDQYLHITECRSGESDIIPIGPNTKLDIEKLVKKWAKDKFCGELRLDGDLMPGLEGDFYAAIYTDGRSPDSGVVWDSGGFYLKSSY